MTFPFRPDLSTSLRRGLFDADLSRLVLGAADRRRALRNDPRARGKVGRSSGLAGVARTRMA